MFNAVKWLAMTRNSPSKWPAGLPADGFVRMHQLVGSPMKPGPMPMSASTLWRLIRHGRFPAPIKLSSRVSVWRVEDVRSYLANIAGGDDAV